MLAKENSSLKAIISQKTQTQEEILKKSIKTEYCQALAYKEMLEAMEGSIHALQKSIEECRKIQLTLSRNRSLICTVEAGHSRNFEVRSGAQDPADDGEGHSKKNSGHLFDTWGNK